MEFTFYNVFWILYIFGVIANTLTTGFNFQRLEKERLEIITNPAKSLGESIGKAIVKVFLYPIILYWTLRFVFWFIGK